MILEKYTFIHSPSLHRDFYQKLRNCFSDFIPIKIIQKNLNTKDLDLSVEKIAKDEYFKKSETKIETNESIEEKKLPQEYGSDYPYKATLDELNEKEWKDSRVQTMFERF